MVTKKTGEELAAEFIDPEWRRQYLRLVDIVTLLRTCIIPANYKIPDRLNAAIHLTEYGTKLQAALTTKHDVPAKEARLMCLLEIAHEEPMVDLANARLEDILEEISGQIIKGAIRYPYVYGGILYRRAAQLFPDRRSQLNAGETRELLEGTPGGVFQVDDLVVGPLGIRRSKESRWLPPILRLPLQHCSDMMCRRVHSTALSTDHDAGINQHLPKMSKILDPDLVARGAWTEFTEILTEADQRPYDDMVGIGVPVALGDCFTVRELNELASSLGIEVSTAGDPATLLQLLWLERDTDIIRSLDALIRAHTIEIDKAEIRRPPLMDVQVGSFELRAEFGAQGVRLKPRSADIPLLRLRRLVGHLYEPGDERDVTELLWQLRGVDGIDLEGRLEEYLRLTPPEEVIEKLVLARRSNVEIALRELHVDLGIVGLGEISPADDDAVIVDKLMWKLGFERELHRSEAADFWRRHGEMKQTLRDAQASAIVNVERLRDVGRNVFVSLEGLLADSLNFAWWALCADHLAAAQPFTYIPSLGEQAWSKLAEFNALDGSASKPRLGEAKTLYPLGQAFAVLGRLLENYLRSEAQHVRADDAVPRWVAQTELREFCFRHTAPFLDLSGSSQSRLVEGLGGVSAVLKRSNVHGIRNGMSHFQRSSSSLDEVEQAVMGAGQAVEALEALGLVRAEYARTRIEVDRWGRSIVVMRSEAGDEVTFQRPSRAGLGGMPSLGTPQYIVRAAVFSAPNEVLRFRAGVDSEFSRMWEDFPLRRTGRRSRQVADIERAGDVARASHGVLPQV